MRPTSCLKFRASLLLPFVRDETEAHRRQAICSRKHSQGEGSARHPPLGFRPEGTECCLHWHDQRPEAPDTGPGGDTDTPEPRSSSRTRLLETWTDVAAAPTGPRPLPDPRPRQTLAAPAWLRLPKRNSLFGFRDILKIIFEAFSLAVHIIF